MNPTCLEALKSIVGADYVITAPEQKNAYLYDEIELTLRPQANQASVVVKPANTEQVSQVMALGYANGIPVVVRGGGTGLCGGAIPTQESIVLSMEKMNRVLDIDSENMMAEVEAGVTLLGLLEALNEYPEIGFPVHPGDEGCQMGGMAATNAGGARAVRHGITRNHIKGLEVVLPDGEVLRLGGKLLKDNAGYNLMQLILGSEGTLAVITKVILRLYPVEKYTATLVVSFESLEQASAAVLEIVASGVSPLAVEYQDKGLNQATARMLGLHWPLQKGQADLILILSEKTENALYEGCRSIDRICDSQGALESFYAGTRKEQADILAIRSGSYEVIKDDIYHSFDMAVPPASMPEFLHKLVQAAQRYHTHTNITAHIADGNVHNDILLLEGKAPPYYEKLRDEMYDICFSYQGTITGEHGVGKLRVEDLKRQKSKRELEIMQGIKNVFDPKGLLNPGTVLPVAGV